MAFNRAAFAQKAWRIRRAMRGAQILDISRFEAEFARFSRFKPRPALRVKLPKVYPVRGEECRHYTKALEVLGLDASAPPAIDALGHSVDLPLGDGIIVLSPAQLAADLLDMRQP